MIELFSWSMGLFLVFGLPNLLGYGKRNEDNQIHKYDDYVNKKMDEEYNDFK